MNHCGSIYGVSLQQLQEMTRLLFEIQGYYNQLIGMAPDPEQVELLTRLRNENEVNIKRIAELYHSISCQELTAPPINVHRVKNYLEGLSKARSLEGEVLPKFVKIYLDTPNIYYTTEFTSIRGFLSQLAATPFLHGTILQYLITKNLFPVSRV